jgi:hypothetical protein
MKRFTLLAGVAAIAVSTLSASAGFAQSMPVQFVVRIENLTTPDQFMASNGVTWSLGFSPGVWMIHAQENPVFTPGELDRGQGLESQAEDGRPATLAESLAASDTVFSNGVFNTPVGMTEAGPIRPGNVYEFTVVAEPGDKLSFTTMFGQSNDWFYAPTGSGIDLFDNQDNPIQGDVTNQVYLWDVGTEVDQEPGIGSEQGPRQSADNTGTPESEVIQTVDNSAYAAPAVMRVTVTPE